MIKLVNILFLSNQGNKMRNFNRVYFNYFISVYFCNIKFFKKFLRNFFLPFSFILLTIEFRGLNSSISTEDAILQLKQLTEEVCTMFLQGQFCLKSIESFIWNSYENLHAAAIFHIYKHFHVENLIVNAIFVYNSCEVIFIV